MTDINNYQLPKRDFIDNLLYIWDNVFGYPKSKINENLYCLSFRLSWIGITFLFAILVFSVWAHFDSMDTNISWLWQSLFILFDLVIICAITGKSSAIIDKESGKITIKEYVLGFNFKTKILIPKKFSTSVFDLQKKEPSGGDNTSGYCIVFDDQDYKETILGAWLYWGTARIEFKRLQNFMKN